VFAIARNRGSAQAAIFLATDLGDQEYDSQQAPNQKFIKVSSIYLKIFIFKNYINASNILNLNEIYLFLLLLTAMFYKNFIF